MDVMKEQNYWAKIVDTIEDEVVDTSMIRWVGSQDGRYAMAWNEFVTKFRTTEYRQWGGYCAIAKDLVVKLNDGSWYEVDPESGYLYNRRVPVLQPGYKEFDKVVGYSSTIDELNEDADK